jgi:hypothetical protein
MTKVHFNDPGVDERSFSKEDFTRHGIDDQDAVVFNKDNGFTNELSAAALEFLTGQGEPFGEPTPEQEALFEDSEKSYADHTKAELLELVNERNVGRESGDLLDNTGTKAELIAQLEDDDQV